MQHNKRLIFMNRRTFLSQTSLAALSLAASPKFVASQTSPSDQPNKILFLGDSITQAADYINFFECQLRIDNPDKPYEIYNLGLSSETISGLSEEDHPFPRPYLHDRLEKVLDYVKPELIFACYGINCGIYHPLEEAIFQKFQEGIHRLIRTAKERQMQLILLTPPPYASPVSDWSQARADLNRDNYGYQRPYAAYDEVMRQYAEWILSVKEVQSIDIQTPMRNFQELCYGQDVIHPNQLGHQLIAHTILHHFNDFKSSVQDISLNWQSLNTANKVNSDQEKATLRQLNLKVPKVNYVVLSDDARYNDHITIPQSYKLILTDCPQGTFQLFDQNLYLGQCSHEELKKGIVISPISKDINYKHLSFAKKARQLYELIASKREVYDYALLQHIGHNRPMNRIGVPLLLAEEKKKALEAKISKILHDQVWEPEIIKLA